MTTVAGVMLLIGLSAVVWLVGLCAIQLIHALADWVQER